MPHLIISDEQMEGIVRFYAGFPICSGEQVETGASFQFVQVSKLQTRMFPGFFFNLLIFLSSAGGQLVTFPIFGPGATACEPLASYPLRHARGMTPPPKGEARLGFLQTPGGLLTRLPLWGRYVPVGRCPAADRGGSRDAGTAAAVTERATALPVGKNASLFP